MCSLKLDIDVKALEALLKEFEGSSREREALLLLNRGVEKEEMRPYNAQLATILDHLLAKVYCQTTFTSTMVGGINKIVKQLNWSANSGDCNEEKPKEVVSKGQTKKKQSQAQRQPKTKRDKQNEEVQEVLSGGDCEDIPEDFVTKGNPKKRQRKTETQIKTKRYKPNEEVQEVLSGGDCEDIPEDFVTKGNPKKRQRKTETQIKTKRYKPNEEVQEVLSGGDSNPGKLPKAGSNGMEEECNLEVECVGQFFSSDLCRKIEAHARCSEWSECNIEARAMEPEKEQGRRLSVMGLETVKVEYAEGETSQHIGFNCSYCDGYFNSQTQLDDHERDKHACAVRRRAEVQKQHWVKRYKAPTKYFCKWCEKKDLTEEQFQKHEKLHFSENLPFTVSYHVIGGQRDIPKYCQ